MLEKLEAINQRWKDVETELSNPDVMSDMKRYAQLNKEYKDLQKVVAAHIDDSIPEVIKPSSRMSTSRWLTIGK